MATLLASTTMMPVEAQAQSARDFVGGLAGGMLGGVIAGAIIANSRPRPVVVYQPRVYRRSYARYYVPRHAPRPSFTPTPATTIDAASDPFGTSPLKPTPVAAKP